jgi:hypothetical protein
MRSATLAALMLAVILTYSQRGNVPLVNQLARRVIRPKADVYTLIYSELRSQKGSPIEEDDPEVSRATEIFDVD